MLWVREFYNNYLADTELAISDQRLYVTSDGWPYCFDYDGNLIWNRSTYLFVDFSSPIFFYDDLVCSGAIKCFERDGTPAWEASGLVPLDIF